MMRRCLPLATRSLSPMLCLCVHVCVRACVLILYFIFSVFSLVPRRRAETFSPADEVSHEPNVMVPVQQLASIHCISSHVFSSEKRENKYFFIFFPFFISPYPMASKISLTLRLHQCGVNHCSAWDCRRSNMGLVVSDAQINREGFR